MDKIKKAALPTTIESISYLMISSILLAGTNVTKFIEYFQNSSFGVVSSRSIDKIIQEFIDKVVGNRFATLSTALFWMFVGIIAYILVWVIITYFQTLKSEISFVQAFVHPLGYDRRQSFHDVVIRALWRLVFAGLFIIWMILLLQYILPASSLAFYVGVINFPQPVEVASLLFGIIFFAVSMFLSVVLLRFAWLRVRLRERWQ